MNKLFDDLNERQHDAVIYGEGPLLIIAGAGTGKTKVITHRIAHLIASKAARPDEILALTFTEKAANEMEERVDLLIPYSYSFVEISTFNSFGERVLRNYGHELGYYLDFKLLDEVEQAIFFREHLFQFPLKYFRPLSSPTKHIRELLSAIKRLKQEDITPQKYLDFVRKNKAQAADGADLETAKKHQEIALVYWKYQRLMERKGKIDFEDQVALTIELFKKRPSVLSDFQRKYKYILVDEFQDTNYLQFRLLKILAERHRNLTVVGDDDQSIFRFRGASLSNILNFKEDFPDCKQIVLTRNYRSTQDILDASYQLIQHNNPERLEIREKIDKALKASKDTEEKSIHLLQFDTLSHEADKVAQTIKERFRMGFSYNEIAILVRRNVDADPFLKALNMEEIPYRFSGSRGLYAREEIRVLISFIKALVDFEDSKSLFYLAISEVYQVDPYSMTLISNFAHKKHLTLHSIFKWIHSKSSPVDISRTAEDKISRIYQDLLFFIKLGGTQNAGQILYAFLEKSGYLKILAEGRVAHAELKARNIRIFFDKVKNFSDVGDDDSIYAFAEHLEMLQQVGDNPATAEAELEDDAVNVLTVHKAKGLEFSVVFLVSMLADRFPGRERKEKISIPDDILCYKLPQAGHYIQEERRLFYVGMTRAKKILYITWAKDYGLKRLKKVSPFVLEALDLVRAPVSTLRTSAIEEIHRYASRPQKEVSLLHVKEKESLELSYFKVEDYLSCPLRYKFRHIMRIPVLPHHNLVYGRVLHNAIHNFLRKKLSGSVYTENDFIQDYFQLWVNEGYLSREHEEMRKAAGETALRSFFRRESRTDQLPKFLEKKFSWQEKKIKFIGRWDRIDYTSQGAVIVDYKATQVKDQQEADKKVQESLQMDLYALSFSKIYEIPLLETRLHFLESDIIGNSPKIPDIFIRAEEKIREAEVGIRKSEYVAKPDWHQCNYCDFKNICPESFAF